MTAYPDALTRSAGTTAAADISSGITIAICTHRRPAIVNALESLAGQDLRGLSPRVLVVDNDSEPVARPAIEAAGQRFRLDLTYLHVPGSNISIARNACLDACETGWLAFIDDDETALPDWLWALTEKLHAAPDLAAIFGPMRAIYDAETPDWIRRGDFHSTAIVFVDGEIRTGYTTNALLNLRHPAMAGKRFDPVLGRSGGEDTDFFDRVFADGGRFAYAPEAIVEEVLTPERRSLRWFLRRRFRSGQTHGRLLARHHPGIRRFPQMMIAGGKAAFCLVMGAASFSDGVRWRRWLLRGALHCGVVARLAGKQEQSLYGETAPAPNLMQRPQA